MVETPARAAPELTVGMLAQRLDGNDEAIRLLQSNADKQPSALNVELQVNALKELMETHINALTTFFNTKIEAVVELKREHFKGIATQFAERDARFEQTSKDRQLAIDAAFQAAKEAGQEQIRSRDQAIAKSEAATTKQIDALHTLLMTTAKGSDDKIDDIKTRLTAIESRTTVTKEVATDGRALIFAVIGTLVGVGGFIFGLVAMLRASGGA